MQQHNGRFKTNLELCTRLRLAMWTPDFSCGIWIDVYVDGNNARVTQGSVSRSISWTRSACGMFGHRSRLSIALDWTLLLDGSTVVLMDDRPANTKLHINNTVSTTLTFCTTFTFCTSLTFSFGTMFQQQLRNVVTALRSSYLERCPIIPLDVHVRSEAKQQPHDL